MHLSKEAQRNLSARFLLWSSSRQTAASFASVGSLPSMAVSAVAQCLLTELFTFMDDLANNRYESATSKGTVRTSQRDKCVLGSTWETAQVTAMQIPFLAGTQCPGLWSKKYPLHISKRFDTNH